MLFYDFESTTVEMIPNESDELELELEEKESEYLEAIAQTRSSLDRGDFESVKKLADRCSMLCEEYTDLMIRRDEIIDDQDYDDYDDLLESEDYY